MVICLDQGANGPAYATATPSSLASLQSRLVPAYPGCPEKEAVKRASVFITPSVSL